MQNSGSFFPRTGQRDSPPAPPATPSRKRFALTGPSAAFDPRIDAARGDLADLRLADRLFAPHYAAAVARTVTARAPLLAAIGGGAISEVLAGETFEVLEFASGHAWGVGAVDGAVGFVAADVLAPRGEVAVRPAHDAAPSADHAALAEALVGIPVVAGGRSRAGVDAAGLVFLTLSERGIGAPRFVDIQAATLGQAVGARTPMIRGDLLFFAGHVAIVADDHMAIHAADRAVERVPIADLIDTGRYGPMFVRRRPA